VRWQRPARIGVALVGIACAAAIYEYGRRGKRPVIDNSTPSVLADQKISARQSGVKKFRKNFAKGDETLTIEAEVETAYTSGLTRLQQVRFTSERENGKVFDIWAGVAESEGKAVTGDEPGLINLTSGVRVKTNDGLEITTDSATYDNIQGLATIPGKLTFKRERLTGEGIGATYDRERDVLWLLDEARVKRERGPDGTGALDATAKSIGLARPDRYMNLRERARIVQPDQTLAADQIVVHFTDDESGAQLMEMHGSARVTPAASAGKGAPDLQSDDIALEFQEDGQTLRHAMMAGRARVVQATESGRQTITATTIDLVTAPDGRTLMNLEAKGGDVEAVLPPAAGRPERTIRSATLVTSGDEKGLKSAVFDGNITFVEGAAGRGARGARGSAPLPARNAKSTSLALTLAGELGAIEKAVFSQNVEFKDGNMTARADNAEHDEKLGTLALTPATGKKATVDDGTVNVSANWIQVTLNTHDLRARELVTIVMTPGKSSAGGQAHTPALFDAALAIRGVGPNLRYTSASREAQLVGSATDRPRLFQNDPKSNSANNRIQAIDLIVNQETGNLTATGQVESVFQLEHVGGSGSTGRSAAPAKAAPTKAAPAKGAPAAASAGLPPAPVRGPETTVRAATMAYTDADRTVLYTAAPGAVATLLGPDDHVEAKEIVLRLAPSERALKTLEATGTMWASFTGGREAMGDSMVYDASSQKHIIKGRPLNFKNVQNDAGKITCSLEQSTELIYEGKDQTINEPAGRAGAMRPSKPVTCATPLKTLVPLSATAPAK
jgi:lipopolysaccharide export system protein LptA